MYATDGKDFSVVFSSIYFRFTPYKQEFFFSFWITKYYTVFTGFIFRGLIQPKLKAYQPFHVVLNSGSWPLRLFRTLDVTSFVLQLIDGLVFMFVLAMCGIHWFTHLYTTVYGIHRLFTDSHICYQYYLVSRLKFRVPSREGNCRGLELLTLFFKYEWLVTNVDSMASLLCMMNDRF